MNLASLERQLAICDWRAANETTRLLLHQSKTEWPERVPVIDRLWGEASNGHFGFTTQCDIYAKLGGFECAPGFETWQHFYRFGEVVGWKLADLRSWYCWEDYNDDPTLAPSLRVNTDPTSVARGCLPFHDVLIDFKSNAFEKRDCWGEYNWDQLVDLYRLVAG